MNNQHFYDVEAVPIPPGDITENMINAYRYSKSVKLFSIIDFIFGIFYFVSYSSYYFVFTCLVSIMGYYGAKDFNSCYSKTYLTWNVFCLMAQTALTIFYINNNYSNMITDNSLGIYIVIGLISFLVKFWVTKIIYAFNNHLSKLSQLEISTIKHIENSPRVVGIYYW